jgi:hypothetical protein
MPLLIQKIVPEVGYDMYTGENRPIGEKQPKAEKKIWTDILIAALETLLRINGSKFLKRMKQKFPNNFCGAGSNSSTGASGAATIAAGAAGNSAARIKNKEKQLTPS